MKVLCIGMVSHNITCKVDDFPVEGGKYNINEKVEYGGGFAYDASYILSSWGMESYVSGVVGNDDYGSKIKKELTQKNVHVDYLETSFEKPTPVSLVLVNKKNGACTEFNLFVEKPIIKKENYGVEPDYILSDGAQYHASLTAIKKFPDIPNFIFAKEDTTETRELCKYSKYVLATIEFAMQSTRVKVDSSNPASLVLLYNKLHEKYPNSQIVITLGPSGAIYSKDKKINLIQSLKVTPNDCSGAGNVFRAAFVYSISVGYDIEKCMQIATIAAGLSVEKFGSKDSIPSLNEVLTYYNKKFGVQTNAVPNISDKEKQNNTQPEVKVEPKETQEAPTLPTEPEAPIKEQKPVSQPVVQNYAYNPNNANNINNPGINPPSNVDNQ